MQTIARTTYVAAAGTRGSIGLRFINWLVALDAGYRNAHKLAAASEERLSDMGISQSEAEAKFVRRLGAVDYRIPVGSLW